MFIVLIALFLMLAVLGLSYLIFLQFIFPTLVPFHGGGESFILNSTNNYTFQIPWEAFSRTHLILKTNGTVELYSNNEYLCDCSSYEFNLEPGDYILVTVESDSYVTGMFEAWQEIPLENQAVGFTILLVGLFGMGISIIALKS